MTTLPFEPARADVSAKGSPVKEGRRATVARRKRSVKVSLPSTADTGGLTEVVVEVLSSTTSVVASNPGVGTVTVKFTGKGVDAQRVLAQFEEISRGTRRTSTPRGKAVALLADVVEELPAESWEQARRLAERRDVMVGSGALAHEDLAAAKHVLVSSARTWVVRQRNRGAIITVNHRGRTLVPAFQLTPDVEPRAALRPVLRELRGLGSWQTWAWLTSPTSLLSGAVPERIVDDEPERVSTAARAFAARWQR